MRCKHSRVLFIIRERLHRESCDGDVFIVMPRNRRIVRMFSFDKPIYGTPLRVWQTIKKTILFSAWRNNTGRMNWPSGRWSRFWKISWFRCHPCEWNQTWKIGYQKSVIFANWLNVRQSFSKKHLILPIRNVGDRHQRIHSKAKKMILTDKRRKMIMMALMILFNTDWVTKNKLQEAKESSKKERDLSNRPDGYKTMGLSGEAIALSGSILERDLCLLRWRDELSIDNNLAERTIRKLTTQRNNSLHYGSEAGAEMAATYHSVIGTVKLRCSSVWNFIGTFFKNIFNRCRNYVNMVTDKITLATRQC